MRHQCVDFFFRRAAYREPVLHFHSRHHICTALGSEKLFPGSFPHLSTSVPTSPQHPHSQNQFSTCTHSERSCRFMQSNFESAPVIPQKTQFLDWFPFYVHRFIGD